MNFKTNQIIETSLNVSNLSKVRLCNYKLKALDKYIFDGLDSLLFLDLNGNELSSIDLDIFDCLSNILELDLSDNCFSTFHVLTFARLTNLKEVSFFFFLLDFLKLFYIIDLG
jgi:Leucine-rich repeat (LRR) protein